MNKDEQRFWRKLYKRCAGNLASVRRLGLITFRIAMVITALHCHDTGELGSIPIYWQQSK